MAAGVAAPLLRKGPAVTPDARTVAVWLREAQWLCADAAHRLPVGDYTSGEQAALADALDKLAYAVRLHAGLIVPSSTESDGGRSLARDATAGGNMIRDRA
jgi:hypothetical protein